MHTTQQKDPRKESSASIAMSDECSSPGYSPLTSPSSSSPGSPNVRPSANEHDSGIDLNLDPLKLSSEPTSNQLATYAGGLIRREAAALLSLASRLETPHDESSSIEHFERAVDILSNLPPYGKLIISGIGKSALIGRKAVASFCSLGIPCIFLDPVAALHGDLGVISPMRCDPVILISQSGRTAEVLNVLPYLRTRCSHVIALTSKQSSPLAQNADAWLDSSIGGDELEAESDLLAPTSSSMVTLALLHTLALSSLKIKTGWHSDASERQAVFAKAHPGGNIGAILSESR